MQIATAAGAPAVVNSPATIFPNVAPYTTDPCTISLGATSGYFWGGRNFGGFEGFAHTLFNASGYVNSTTTPQQNVYPLQTPPSNLMSMAVGPLLNPSLAANATSGFPGDYEEAIPPTFLFKGGTINVKVYYGNGTPSGSQLLQQLAITFPPAILPAPRGDDIIDAEPFSVAASAASPPVLSILPVGAATPILKNTTAAGDGTASTTTVNGGTVSLGGSQMYGQLRRWYWSYDRGSFDPNQGRTIPSTSSHAQSFTNAPTNLVFGRTVGTARDFQQRINYVLNCPGGGQGNNSYDPETPGNSAPGAIVGWNGGRWRQLLQPGDTVRSMIFCNMPTTTTASMTTSSGDLRLAAITNQVTSPAATATTPGFYPHPDYGPIVAVGATPAMAVPLMRQACLLRMADTELYYNYAGDPFFNTAVTATTGWGPTGYLNTAQNGNNGTSGTYSNQTPFGNHIALTSGRYFNPTAAVGDLPRMLGYKSTNITSLLTPMINGLVRLDGKPADFDTGVGAYPDGPYFNKQDEGNAIFSYLDPDTGLTYYPIPYFGNGAYAAPGSAFNSPNRQMPSPVMMGSLLSQAAPNGQTPNTTAGAHGWETLCFCPNPAGSNHYGNSFNSAGSLLPVPKDHLLLDLFQMPAVQPYPISEPFSTAGKINLNCQIQPFDYISRQTGLRAALATERVMVLGSTIPMTLTPATSGGAAATIAVPTGLNASSPLLYWCYKQQSNSSAGYYNLINSPTTRNLIDRDQTMNEINAYVALNGVFKSPSQICEIFLIPWQTAGFTAIAPNAGVIPFPSTYTTSFTTVSNNALTAWTPALGLGDLTGDNVREKPYADIYPRLTTKSNTYTIHMKVQALRQQPHPSGSTAYLIWDESKDAVLGEYRGSATIERYLDPADPHFTGVSTFVNPDSTSPANSLESLYRFRTVNTKKFSP